MKKLDKVIVAVIDSGVEEVVKYRGASVTLDETSSDFTINDIILMKMDMVLLLQT